MLLYPGVQIPTTLTNVHTLVCVWTQFTLHFILDISRSSSSSHSDMKYKIVESGGRTVKSKLQKSNPTATPGCDNADCLACAGGRWSGGLCLKSNVQYEMQRELCPDTNKCMYIGESSQNLYTRAKEHIGKYNSRKRCHDSFIKKHQDEKHQGRQAQFQAKTTEVFKDCLERQSLNTPVVLALN